MSPRSAAANRSGETSKDMLEAPVLETVIDVGSRVFGVITPAVNSSGAGHLGLPYRSMIMLMSWVHWPFAPMPGSGGETTRARTRVTSGLRHGLGDSAAD